MRFVAVNGMLVEKERAVVSVFDHGFLYGIGLFETMRTYGGAPFLLDRHLARLADGCRRLGIRHEPDEGEVRRLIRRLLDANGLKDGIVRLSVSAGEGPLGLPEGPYESPVTVIFCKPLPPVPASRPLQLLRLRRNTPEGSVREKSFHYMNNVLAKRELSTYPWAAGAEGLFLDAAGRVAEGVVSNVFFAAGGVLHTPSAETGILPGVTRGEVLRLAAEDGIEAREGLYGVDDLWRANELFLTNSVQELVPVHAVYDETGAVRWRWSGKPGPLTERLKAAYRRETEREAANAADG
jgi:4-amino-4-deoxychorismate lyase